MITTTQLGKAYGAQVLFADASLQFDAGRRYGIVGANGSGKSTLMNIVAGEEEASQGQVAFPKRARIGKLSQDHFQYESVPIIHVVMMGNAELWAAMEEKDQVLAAAHDFFDGERYAILEDLILGFDGYGLEARAAQILEGLNIPAVRHGDPLSTLSGGYKLRVLLAQTLAAEPDILLLDEPTNHLDIVSVRWFEGFLSKQKGCVLLVSHDRSFLDSVCTHIVDVDYEMANLYPGNYTAFEKLKQSAREHKEIHIEKQEKEIADKERFIRRFKAKASKARQAQSRVKQLEKIVIERLPTSSRRHPKFRFQSCRPPGKVALEVDGITKSYGDNLVLHDVSFQVRRGDRVALIGPNGIGKSTLLKLVMGDLEPDAGQSEWGHETYPGYFAQDHKELLGDGAITVNDWLWQFCPLESLGFVRSHLALVLFSRDEVEKKVRNLSGGEAARLIMARMMVEKPNVLILDEPTNHLDMEGVAALASALSSYDGTIIFVSHDRWFVSQLATRVITLRADGFDDFKGSYDDFVARADTDHLDTEAVLDAWRQDKKTARRDRKSN
jgi:ATPase subunit of ABC transporter with duplicated ATPase domains